MTMSRRVVVGAVVAAVALFALWFLLLWGPQGGRIDDAREREDRAEEANAQLELRLARLRASQDRVPQLLAELETLEVAIPDQPDLAQFILDANEAASLSGVDFLSISPSPPAESAEPGLPQEIALAITVEGGYFQVLDYLNRLDALPRLVVVDNLNLTPGEDTFGGQQLAVSLTGRMFTTAEAPLAGADPGDPATTPTTTPPPVDTTTTTEAAG